MIVLQSLEGGLCVVGSHHHHSVAVLVAHKGVHILHRNLGAGENLQHSGQSAGTVVDDSGHHVTLLYNEIVVSEHLTGLVRVVDNETENPKIGGVRQGEGTHVDAVFP